ncbi:7586_t:CDS:2, partial [Paraglomus occultum]
MKDAHIKRQPSDPYPRAGDGFLIPKDSTALSPDQMTRLFDDVTQKSHNSAP